MLTKCLSKLYLIIIAVMLSACAQQTTNTFGIVDDPKQVGVKLKNLVRIDSLLSTALVNNKAAGISALVAKDGKIFYHKAFGFKDRENKAILKTLDYFRITTMSKPIIALATLNMIEQGKLNLNDPISKFLPDFKKLKVLKDVYVKDSTFLATDINSEITIKQLLNESSGIEGGLNNSPIGLVYEKNGIFPFINPKVELQENVKKIATLPLSFEPSKKYSEGLSLDIMGAILEVASGLSLDSMLRKTIFVPAGMLNTHFYLPTQKFNRLVVLYNENSNERLDRSSNIIDKVNISYPISNLKKYFSGSYGLNTTTEDYAKFLQLLLSRGKINSKQIINENAVNLFNSGELALTNNSKNKMAYGVEFVGSEGILNRETVGTMKGKGIFNTFFWVDPKRNSLALLFTQVYPSTNGLKLQNDFQKIVNEIIDDKIIK